MEQIWSENEKGTEKSVNTRLLGAFRMPKTGVEPATYALRVRCSANWAISASYINNYTSVPWNCKDIEMNLYRRNPTWLRFLRNWKKFLKIESYRLKLIISYDKLISLLSERSLIKQFQKNFEKVTWNLLTVKMSYDRI